MAKQLKPDLPLIIFTDLDGTLLDHHTYRYDQARDALDLIQTHRIPLILVSSKTVAEIMVLVADLGIVHPLIAENGAVISYPPNCFLESDPEKWTQTIMGETYERITEVIGDIRQSHDFKFTGFQQLSISEIEELTGLDYQAAERAKQRQATEPLIWQDSNENLAKFSEALSEHDLTLTQGGRFYHVMGNNSKGQSVRTLVQQYRQAGWEIQCSVALGDSENDLSMLAVVDQPVVIRRPDSSYLRAGHLKKACYTTQIGPQGWNEFLTSFISNFSQHAMPVKSKGTNHG